MSPEVSKAERLRRQRANQGAGLTLLLILAVSTIWTAAYGERALPALTAAIALACVPVIVAARRGHELAAGYGVGLLAMAAVLGAALILGNPGYASFLLVIGVLLSGVTLPPRHLGVIIGVGVAAEVAVALWSRRFERVETPGGEHAEGPFLFLFASAVALLTSASVAWLLGELRRRDAEARAADERAGALERKLEESQRMEALGRLAGGVAHDFNNLLTVMRGCVTLLAESTQPSPEARVELDDLSAAVDRASTLTNQLLTFSRRQVVQVSVVDLQAVAEGMRDLLQRLVGPEVTLKLEAAGGPCLLLASPSQLEQVLMNLAANARDAMSGKGELRVRVERGHDARLGEVCRLVVTDSGVGMAPEVSARIFEPFFTTKAPGQGTGLGLATVYGIVSALGGRIEVTSSPGHGAEFTTTLPVAVEARPPPRAARAAPLPPGAPRSVCVVDDEAVVRTLMARILGGAGLTVHTFASAEALIHDEHHPCDALVTDINLPGMSGVSLAEHMREGRPGFHVVLVSGCTTDPAPISRLLAGGAVFLAKPFAPDALVAAVLGGPREVAAPESTVSA
ncbi:MAG: hypothetical protein A2138_07130 [Deltaproteobacteria bacterium RBG_16_71_12]|nr:MAG: hypothetical protein A2138_07130 [Deltaproteobacteria bacterium RBG_16_71_12]